MRLLSLVQLYLLWTGEEKCHGSRCLLAWERVCQTKEDGGLGLKNLEDMNHSLLLKIAHRLHDHSSLPWKDWFLSQNSHVLSGPQDTYLCSLLSSELSRYRSITTVTVGNGELTSFWHDRWLLNSPLAATFPVLFSHCTHPEISVHHALRTPLSTQLHVRLTRSAAAEQQVLSDCLAHVHLTDELDTHLLASLRPEPFTSGGAYKLLSPEGPHHLDAMAIWHVRLPTKLKFFAWLLCHGRLNTRDYLYRRSIRPLSESFCELCPTSLETDWHIFVSCPLATSVWDKLALDVQGCNLRFPWLIGLGISLPEVLRVNIVFIVLWQLWKARNAKIFDHVDSCPP